MEVNERDERSKIINVKTETKLEVL